MKKYIISLITILSSLFIIGNVKASNILIYSEDLATVSKNGYKGNLTTDHIQEIMNNNPNYDFVNKYKYYAILLKHWDRVIQYEGYTNSNKMLIVFFSKEPEFVDGYIKLKNIEVLEYITGCANENCTVDFDNLDLKQTLEYHNVTSGLYGANREFANEKQFLAYDNMNPDLYMKPPSFTYEIKNPSNNKWSIDFKFENLTNNYYYLLKKTINNEIVKKYEYPTTTDSLNVFYDNNFKMELYDKDDNLIDSKVIDVQGLYWKQKSKYYVLYSYLSSNKIFYSYFGVLKDETCWFGETVGQVTSFVEKDCSNSYIYEFNKNNIIHWQIRDKEDKVLFQREISVIGDPNETYINLETELKNDNSVDLKINVQNFKKDSQYIVYRIDKGEEIQVENNKVINFKYNARVDVYVYNLNNTISSTAYKDIVVDVTTLRPSPEYEDLNSILDYFKNITEINSSLLSQFSNFWANLKKSELYIPLLISFIGSCILCVIAILKR